MVQKRMFHQLSSKQNLHIATVDRNMVKNINAIYSGVSKAIGKAKVAESDTRRLNDSLSQK